jgi:uncharacterized membrane protein YoaK (UPF0700 family)
MGESEGQPGAPPVASARKDTAGRTRDALLIGLTFATGVVDAVSYLGLGQIFTANMTGNVVFLALAVGERSLLTALRSAAALFGFSLGAVVAGRLLIDPRPSGIWPRRVTPLLGIEAACLIIFAAAWVAVGGEPGTSGLIYVIIGLSSIGMGVQNAAARHLAVPGLTTTVITMSLTGFMVDLPALGISGSSQRRAIWTVIALFSGAAIGAALLVSDRLLAPLVTVVTVGTVAAIAYVAFDRPSRNAA